MASMPMFPLWVADYLNDTRGLTQAEHGAYLLLLMAAWHSKDGSLPDDNAILARLAGCHHHTWKRQRETVLTRFFVRQANGSWINERVQKERAKAESIINKRSEAAAKAGKASAAARGTPAQEEGGNARTGTGGVKS